MILINSYLEPKEYDMKRFSPSKIRALREQAGLSRPRLAFALGRSPETVRDWEWNRYVPNGESMLAITQFFNCTLDDLSEDASDA